MSHRPKATRALCIGAVAMVLLATGCEVVAYSEADAERQQAGLPTLDRSPILAASARATSAASCAAGQTQPSAHPTATYDRETIAAAGELVGSAPLDPSIADPVERNVAATRAIIDDWPANPVSNPRWDDIGVGEVTCPDGRLYLTAAVTDRPTMPATGRYSSPVYPLAQVQEEIDTRYSTAENYLGNEEQLFLDIYQPPASDTVTERPVVILVHGGGYTSGDKSSLAQDARTYARRGYVAVSINYRLDPTVDGPYDPRVIDAGLDALDDGREAVRWLRAHATEYGLDTERMAMIGQSAGGGIALGAAAIDDPTPGGPLAAYSPEIDAAVSAGLTLSQVLDRVTIPTSASPLMMLHYEIDTANGETTEDVVATCEAMWAVGGTCDQIILEGEGHGSPLRAGGPWWTPEIGPYLWEHLDLG